MKNQKIAIWGLGITGQATLNYFLNSKRFEDINLVIDIYDGSEPEKFQGFVDSIQNKIPDQSTRQKVNFFFNKNNIENITDYDFVMASPSISEGHPDILRARTAGTPVYNDVSYFISQWQKTGKKSIGVTGSNGKSTVVNLIHGALLASGIKSILVGNIGKSPLDYLLEYEKDNLEIDIPVLELSSYQLETFSPEQFVDIAVVTNISPNHLDHHNNSMEEYVAAKLKITGPETKIVTVIDDEGIKKYVLPQINNFIDVSLENLNPKLTNIIAEENRALKGQHNLYNIAMALEVLDILEIDNPAALDFIKSYSGLEHRIEFVREIEGVKYINDSKSTSPDATKVALEAFGEHKNIVLISGGNDKKVSFSSLEDSFNQYVKFLVIFNHDINQKLIGIAERYEIPYEIADNLADCVKIAKEKAKKSVEFVLFSPGAASLGKFNNFEHRGQIFKEEVNSM